MKAFDQLTKIQMQDAIDLAVYELMELISDGTLELSLIDPASQKRLEMILTKARKAESMRLVKLHLIHDVPIRKELYRLAMVAASGSMYTDDGEPIMENGSEIIEHIAGK